MGMKQFWDKLWHQTLGRPYRLHVEESGEGEPVVLLHGLGQSGKKWEHLVAKLEGGRWRVIVPDLLGFGRSPKPQWGSYTAQEHAHAVMAALKRRGLKGAAVLVGHSMGCLVAVHIAATRPDLVKRLVLYEPPLFADDPVYRKHTRRRGHYFRLYQYIASRPQLAAVERQMIWRAVSRVAGLRLTGEELVPFERSLHNTIMAQTTYNELRRIVIPTNIIHGRWDLIVTRSQIDEMFAHNRHITIHMSNTTHDISPRAALFIVRILGPSG